MKNYVYIYYADPGQAMGDEDQMAAMKKMWMDWFGSMGDKLVDGGNPFGPGAKAVSKDGVMDVKEMPATGYSIVKAESHDQAVEWSKGCPVLQQPGGAVCVYETMPM